jgi:hypothetical protein
MPWRCRPRQILETQWHSAVVEALKVHANAVGPNLPWLPISPQVLAIPARVIRHSLMRRLARRALGGNPFESARQTLPMYKHAEHRPHRAANKHQQRENHPPHHLRRQEQPDLRHLQLLL